MKDTKVKQTIFNILKSRMYGADNQNIFPSNDIIFEIIKSAKKLFKSENSLLKLHGNFVVVGDIHGNIDDLLRIFEKCGYPPESNYLFLGDYVDRGNNSSEVIILLFCLKILFPKSIYLIRGNHECETVSTMYGFKKECLKVFDNQIYTKFIRCFMYLSYAAVINDIYFCVHGGISPFLSSLDEIDELEKPMASSDSQLASDLVWSDPNESIKGFQNSSRGSGYFFGNKKLNNFLHKNGLKKLIRSHESCIDGIDYPLENCITIFSNSDYCEMNNDAAVIIINQNSSDNISSHLEDSDEKSAFTFTEYLKDDHNIQIETFSPLTLIECKKRIILMPKWILLNSIEKDVIQDAIYSISPHELLDQLVQEPICVY